MHLESVGVRTLWRTLIAFAFVQDGLEGKGPILCSRVGETGVSTRVVGDKASNLPEIATDSVALDGFSFCLHRQPLQSCECCGSHFRICSRLLAILDDAESQRSGAGGQELFERLWELWWVLFRVARKRQLESKISSALSWKMCKWKVFETPETKGVRGKVNLGGRRNPQLSSRRLEDVRNCIGRGNAA